MNYTDYDKIEELKGIFKIYTKPPMRLLDILNIKLNDKNKYVIVNVFS